MQEAVLHLCYLLDAWASLDVAVLVLAIACHEFSKMAMYLAERGVLAKPCTAIKKYGQVECLEIQFREMAGISILILAGVLLLIVPKITMRVCTEATAQKQKHHK